jgi:hypothetical protein
MKSIVQAGIVALLVLLCCSLCVAMDKLSYIPTQSVKEYSPYGNVTGFGGLAIEYDIQGLKITEFQDWRRVLSGYPTGSKVTIIFKVSGPYSIEGNLATDCAISLNNKVIEDYRAPDQGGAAGWSYSPKPVVIDITDDIKKNGFSVTATVGYRRSSNTEGIMVTVVGKPFDATSNSGLVIVDPDEKCPDSSTCPKNSLCAEAILRYFPLSPEKGRTYGSLNYDYESMKEDWEKAIDDYNQNHSTKAHSSDNVLRDCSHNFLALG